MINLQIINFVTAVPIGEASVVIAISSAHRKESLEAVQFAIDEVKAKVPIWKKEFFEDGAVWADGEPFPDTLRPHSAVKARQ